MTKTTKSKSINEFMDWLKEEKKEAHLEAMGGASSWDYAYSEALDNVYKKARKFFVIKTEKSKTKSNKIRLNKKTIK